MSVLFNFQPSSDWARAGLVIAVGSGLWLAIFPTLFRRKTSGDPQVIESVLARVHQFRRGRLSSRYSHFNAVKTRRKLLAEARERLKRKPFFRNRPPG